MDERRYRILSRLAVGLTLAWILWTLYDASPPGGPHSQQLSAATRQLEDGHYQAAHELFEEVYQQDPQNLAAQRGMAQALMQLGLQAERRGLPERSVAPSGASANRHFVQALTWYDRAITAGRADEMDESNVRMQGVTHANRGILRDHMGDHRGALQDYTAALRLAPEVAEGPGWLTRFLRNQPERPPNIAQRAAYLREQLGKPENKRLMRQPETDHRQRSYTID